MNRKHTRFQNSNFWVTYFKVEDDFAVVRCNAVLAGTAQLLPEVAREHRGC